MLRIDDERSKGRGYARVEVESGLLLLVWGQLIPASQIDLMRGQTRHENIVVAFGLTVEQVNNLLS